MHKCETEIDLSLMRLSKCSVSSLQSSMLLFFGNKRVKNCILFTYSFECEVTLKDHFPDLCEDCALSVGQIHPSDASVSHTNLVLVPSLLRLTVITDIISKDRKKALDIICQPSDLPTFCRASSSSLLFFSSCLLAALLDSSSWERLVDERAL